LDWIGRDRIGGFYDPDGQSEVKTLVVGSAGFVGSNLNIKDLNNIFYGVDIREQKPPLNLNYFHQQRIDYLSDEAVDYVKKLNPDYLVVLAGVQFTVPIQKRANREDDFFINIEIANQSVKLLKLIPSIKKLIYVSTDMVYGVQKSNLVDEQVKPRPVGEYGQSKLKAEKILMSHASKVVILRPRLIIGPGRVGTIKLLARFISGNLPIPLIGRGNNHYQMLSVFDLWDAIAKCFVYDVNGIYNLGSKNPPTLNELFPKVLESLERKNLIIRLPKKVTEKSLLLLDRFNLSPLAPEQFLIAGQNCKLSIEKFQNATGWVPSLSDEEMITRSLQELTRDHGMRPSPWRKR